MHITRHACFAAEEAACCDLTVVGGMVAYTTAEKQICPTAVHMGSQLEWVLRHTAHDVAAGLWACLHPLEILLILVPGTLVHSTAGRYMRYTHLARRSPAGATARSVGRAGPGKSCFCKRHAVSCFAGHWEVQNLFPFTREICCGPVSAMLRGGGQCRTCCPGVQRPCVLCACICSQPALSALQGLRGLATHVISNFYSVPRGFNLPFGNALSPAPCCRGYAISFGFGQLDD